MFFSGYSGHYKVVYTDYTNAVIYFCMSGNYKTTCPQDQLFVTIVSRLMVIPEDELELLYRYVHKTCVPVTDLTESIPGKSEINLTLGIFLKK